MQSQSLELEQKPIAQLILKYAIPSIIAAITIGLYNIVDRIFIGQGVGPLAISGLTLTFPIINILAAFGMLIGQGAATQISIYLGKKDLEFANKINSNAVVLNTIVVLIVSYSLLFFLDPILVLFGGSEETIPYASEYLRIILPFQAISSLSWGYNNILRAAGFPKKSMMIMIIGALINTALDPIFIYGFDLGIKGAAWATVIALAISSTLALTHFLNPKREIHFQWRYFKLDKTICLKIIGIGLSPFFIQLGGSMVNLITNLSLKHYGGDLAIGAYGIVTGFASLIIMSIVGLNGGTQPIIGYNYGAGRKDRVKKAIIITTTISTIVTGITCLYTYIAPQTIAQLFTTDPELLSITTSAIRYTFSLFLIVGPQVVWSNYFQSIGSVRTSITMSLSRQILFMIPLILILPRFFGLNGIFLAQPIADLFGLFLAIYFMRKEYKKGAFE